MAVKIWVIYYSMYGHVRKMAQACVEGLRKVDGVEVTMYQVAETLPEEVLQKMHAPPKDTDHPIVDVKDLPNADAFLFGFPTRFNNMPAQFKAFCDQQGQLWMSGALSGKPYGLFTSTASQHGGQETTAVSAIMNFTAHGMVYVPAGYAPEITQNEEVTGGTPFGPATIAGTDGSRQPTAKELAFAVYAGERFAKIAKKLAA